jgi:hypothetical protein
MKYLVRSGLIGFFLISLISAQTSPQQNSPLSVRIIAEPKSYTGLCPANIKFTIEFSTTSLSPITVQYQLFRSDGAKSELRTISLSKINPKKITETWQLSQDYSGWEAVRILSPVRVESNKAEFTVKCTGIVVHFKPDLTVSFKGPSSVKQGESLSGKYKIVVKNIGLKEARDFYVDIKLVGWAGSEPPPVKEHLCGRGFVAIVQPSGTGVISGLYPSIPPDIPQGNYKLCAVVDSTETVDESDENNNRVCQSITILKSK